MHIVSRRSDKVKISLHKIYSTDGIELDSILFEPLKPTKKIIIHLHGKEGHFIQNHFVSVMGNNYPQRRYAFMTFNNRGHDYIADLIKKTTSGFIWQQGGTAFDLLEEVVNDLEGVLHYIKNLGYEEVILQGHSLAPHKICYFLTHTSMKMVTKVIFLSTGDTLFLLDTYVKEWKKYSLIAKELIETGKGKELLPIRLWSNCIVSADTFWNYTHPDSNYFAFNTSSPEREFINFNRIKLPILMIHPETDFAIGVNSYEAIKILKEKSVSQYFRGYVMKNAVHNYIGKEEELVAVINDWIS